jgi:type I restriction enzyme M protein
LALLAPFSVGVNKYALTPGRYVGAADVEDDGELLEEKIERLSAELLAQFDKSERLAAVVREQLRRVANVD